MDVLFPLAGPVKAFGVVRCLSAAPDMPGDNVAIVMGRWGGLTARACDTLDAARHELPAHAHRRVIVRIRIEADPGADPGDDFDGDSWQLALAIADRMLLEQAAPTRRIIATGTLPVGQGGAIGAIEGLAIKLGHALEVAQQGDAVLFPGANLARGRHSPEIEAGILRLRANGVVVHGTAAMPELGFLWHGAANLSG